MAKHYEKVVLDSTDLVNLFRQYQR
jgi:hypothetical protein